MGQDIPRYVLASIYVASSKPDGKKSATLQGEIPLKPHLVALPSSRADHVVVLDIATLAIATATLSSALVPQTLGSNAHQRILRYRYLANITCTNFHLVLKHVKIKTVTDKLKPAILQLVPLHFYEID